jgi:hypothetical protein
MRHTLPREEGEVGGREPVRDGTYIEGKREDRGARVDLGEDGENR